MSLQGRLSPAGGGDSPRPPGAPGSEGGLFRADAPRLPGTPATYGRLFRSGGGGTARPPDAPAWRLARQRGIRVGTASWTDRTLLEPGLFYPPQARTPAERLRFYASQFPIVEVDATYYGLPSERNARAWVERTPSGFVFNVKAFSMLTRHPTAPQALPADLRAALPEELARKPYLYPGRDPVPEEVTEEVWRRFCEPLRPLAAAGKLGAVLFQFPEWFPPGRAARDYILSCRDRLAQLLPDAWCAVELRNAAWMRDAERRQQTLGFLADHELPYVCVDMPQGFPSSIPPLAAVTAPLAMVRFHGRRSETWGRRGVPVTEKFRYDYSPEELEEWRPRIDALAASAREVHVLMNNCYRDYAVRSARTMVGLLAG